ncbi:MAG: O-antigen ligase family protein [Candidatus Aminicenantes bacterium]|nr:O-antigen ligase family protein [Candidatus Aminicenantes bacterium]
MKKSGWIYFPAAFFFVINFAVSETKILFFSRLLHFLFFISLFFLLRRFDLNKILKAAVAGVSVIIFSYGVFQKFFLFPHYLKSLSPGDNFYSQALITRIKSGRIFSIFALPTLYAIVCAVLILFIFHYLIKSRGVKNRAGWMILLLLGLFNLILTQSFGGILYLSAGIMLYLILSGILDFKFLAPAVMALVFFFFLVTGLRFSEAKELEPVKLRVSNWKQAVRMIEVNPFFGQGLGNYESQISYFILPDEARSIYAHNFILQFTAESGVIFPFFILLLLLCCRKKLKPRDYRKNEKVLHISALFILLCYNLIDIGFYFFSAAVVGVVCLSQVYRRSVENKRGFKLNMALTFFLGLFLAAGNFSDMYRHRGDFWLNQADYTEAGNNYGISLKINPYNIRSLAGCAYIQYHNNNIPRCEHYVDRALQILPGAGFANFLASRIAYKRKQYLRALYYAGKAREKNRLNLQYKRWYDSIENNLQAALVKPGN